MIVINHEPALMGPIGTGLTIIAHYKNGPVCRLTRRICDHPEVKYGDNSVFGSRAPAPSPV